MAERKEPTLELVLQGFFRGLGFWSAGAVVAILLGFAIQQLGLHVAGLR